MRLCHAFFAIFLCSSLSSCASITRGQNQDIPVVTHPMNGVVVTDGYSVWKMPSKIILKRKENHMLIFFKEGYEPRVVHLRHVGSALVLANLLLPFGTVGFGVDIITGADQVLVPDTINIDLKPEEGWGQKILEFLRGQAIE